MNSSNNPDDFLPFPPFPDALAEKYAAKHLGLRPFGIVESDLAIDFAKKNNPALVTLILEQCTTSLNKALPTDFFQDLSIGKRLECLLWLARGFNERQAFSFLFKCHSCQLELEFELTLAEIAEQQREADLKESIEIETGGRKLVFRKPLGRDQENWQNFSFPDERAAALTLAKRLQTSPDEALEIRDEALALIDEAMDEADPLVNFNCRVRCFDCDSVNEFPVDLYDFALGELNRAQNRLLNAVHRLASRYHWSEKEIFAVPHWRRMQYLNLIAEKR